MTKEQPNNWEEQISEWFNFKPSSLGGELSMGRFEKQEVINFIKEVISQEKEKCIKEEVFAFMHHLQEKANTLPPNLLLNEVVNYAYDRVSLLQNK